MYPFFVAWGIRIVFIIYLYYINLHILPRPPHLGVQAIHVRIKRALNHFAFLVPAPR